MPNDHNSRQRDHSFRCQETLEAHTQQALANTLQTVHEANLLDCTTTRLGLGTCTAWFVVKYLGRESRTVEAMAKP